SGSPAGLVSPPGVRRVPPAPAGAQAADGGGPPGSRDGLRSGRVRARRQAPGPTRRLPLAGDTPMTIRKRGRYWAVYDARGELVAVCVYRKGGMEVLRRLARAA